MKDFIFSLNNLGNTTRSSNSNGYSSYTQSLFDKAMNAVPYFKKPQFRTTPSSETPFYMFPFAVEKQSPLLDPNYKYRKIQQDLDVYEAWKNAVNRMQSYRNYYGEKSYDTMIGGIPANFFGDFAIIGDTIVPTYASRAYFNRLPQESRVTILNVSITIIKIFTIE